MKPVADQFAEAQAFVSVNRVGRTRLAYYAAGLVFIASTAEIERHRDNPDGRNHLCAPPPDGSYPTDTVFCF
jgi:hypothetical protein